MLPFEQVVHRLLFAALLGAAIGVERDLRRRPGGIRTSMFVCLATALFTILSQQLSMLWHETGPTRIASNIVQGIGFLGAGAILKDSGSLVGMTTAATIFVEAAIGMAAGGGFYGTAASTAAIVLFALVVVGWATERFSIKSRSVLFRLTTNQPENVVNEVQQLLDSLKISVQRFRNSAPGPNCVVEFEAEVRHREEMKILSELNRRGIVLEMIPDNGGRHE
jgi:putative Mg2+ transporter-C (MgtC) family protein